MEYMRTHEGFEEVLPAYVAVFENCAFRDYDVPEFLNRILRAYQVYFRDVFYCGLSAADAGHKLLMQLRDLLDMPDADENALEAQLEQLFEANGYHALFGNTQGFYGPYVWHETVPTTFSVALPNEQAAYTVNILKGFVFRSSADMKHFPGITPSELEYRAKLVELIYMNDPEWLQKFLSEAHETRSGTRKRAVSDPYG